MKIHEINEIEIFWILGLGTTEESRMNLVSRKGKIEHFPDRIRSKMYVSGEWHEPIAEFIIFSEDGHWRYKCDLLADVLTDDEKEDGLELKRFDGEDEILFFHRIEFAILHIHCRK